MFISADGRFTTRCGGRVPEKRTLVRTSQRARGVGELWRSRFDARHQQRYRVPLQPSVTRT